MKRVLFALSVFVLASCARNDSATTDNTLISATSSLAPNKLVGRNKLAPHIADTFKLDLAANTFIYGYADQHDVDVIVKIFTPGKREIAAFDSPARGPEYYKFIADSAGVYQILVEPFESQSGEYSIVLSGVSWRKSDRS